MSKIKKPTAVKAAAKLLRADALTRQDGEFLGSEQDLLSRFKISRPTLRQACALLVQEQLLLVKRGVNGGYFCRRPTTKGVAHTAAIYLQSRSTSLKEIIKAVLPIKVEMAMLACRNRDSAGLKRLEDLRAHDETLAKDDYRGFLRSEHEFGAILGDLSGNNVLRLFIEILYDFVAQLSAGEDIFRNRPDRIAEYWQQRNRLLEAVLHGDEELAVVLAKRCSTLNIRWAVEDVGVRNAAKPFAPDEDGVNERTAARDWRSTEGPETRLTSRGTSRAKSQRSFHPPSARG